MRETVGGGRGWTAQEPVAGQRPDTAAFSLALSLSLQGVLSITWGQNGNGKCLANEYCNENRPPKGQGSPGILVAIRWRNYLGASGGMTDDRQAVDRELTVGNVFPGERAKYIEDKESTCGLRTLLGLLNFMPVYANWLGANGGA